MTTGMEQFLTSAKMSVDYGDGKIFTNAKMSDDYGDEIFFSKFETKYKVL